MNLLKKVAKKLFLYTNMDEKINNLHNKAYKHCKKGHKALARYYESKIYKIYHCCISMNAQIGKNVKFPHPVGIVIGEGAIIGNNVTIYQNVTLGRKNKNNPEYPIIKDNVTIYSGSTIVGDIEIGENTIVGCNTVVLKTVPPNSTCVGIVK